MPPRKPPHSMSNPIPEHVKTAMGEASRIFPIHIGLRRSVIVISGGLAFRKNRAGQVVHMKKIEATNANIRNMDLKRSGMPEEQFANDILREQSLETLVIGDKKDAHGKPTYYLKTKMGIKQLSEEEFNKLK